MRGLTGRRAAAWTLVASLPVILWVPQAGAQTQLIEIPLETVVRGAEGSEHHLTTVPVPEDMIGLACVVSAVAHNQESVHPGNDLIVSSGTDSLVLENVEGASSGETVGEGTLILGATITVTLVLGPDGVFSAGMTVEAVCEAPTTTTTMGPTTTVQPTTTATTPSTTVPGDTTTSSTVLGTSTTTTSTVPPPTVMGTSTTIGPTSTTPSTLPFTGVNADAGAAAALVAIGAGTLLVGLTTRPRTGRHLR